MVNNAGMLRDTGLWKLSDADWESVLDAHAGGTFRFTRACKPSFRATEAAYIRALDEAVADRRIVTDEGWRMERLARRDGLSQRRLVQLHR